VPFEIVETGGKAAQVVGIDKGIDSGIEGIEEGIDKEG
jgi:hypothetical protein